MDVLEHKRRIIALGVDGTDVIVALYELVRARFCVHSGVVIR